MLILITYDVNTEDKAGAKRLRQVAKLCEDYGQRVQNSVFECSLDPARYKFFQKQLLDVMDKEADSLRFYNLGNEKNAKIEHFGMKSGYNPSEALIL